MRERYELGLKVVCALLGAWLLFQAGRFLTRPNPLTNLKIPALPTLANASDSATNSVSGKTNAANSTAKESAKGKNNSAGAAAAKGTNPPSDLAAGKGASNSVSSPPTTQESAANHQPSKLVESLAHAGTNEALPPKGATNLVAATGDTNKPSGTNANPKAKKSGMPPDMAMMMAGGPGRPGRQKAADLAPAVQARVDKIVDSELLGPVIRPMPMALLGIAGNVAFIRSPTGQTGLVKEGDEMGGIKLLRIGTNRVLVEQSGEKKELMIFSGYGGESLMPKENEKTNEPTSKKS